MAKFADLYRVVNLPACGFRQAKELEAALGEWRFSEKESVAIIITDQTRPLDPKPALEALETKIKGDSFVIVGLGLHRNMREEELAGLKKYKPIQHNPDRESEVEKAVWSISIGVAELHQYAGVSGGYKGIVVGCGTRELIGKLHSREIVCHSSVQLGKVEGNIFRERIDELGRQSNCALVLNFLPATGDWLFGIPDLVTKQARKLIRPWLFFSRSFKGIRLHIPSSKSKSFYQASRAATYLALSPRPPLQEGGIIELVASCEEGIGEEEGFVFALKQNVPPWENVLEGEEPTGAGAQRILMLARMAKRFHLRIIGCQNPEIFLEIGIEATSEIAPLPEDWLEIKDPFYQIPQQKQMLEPA